MGNDKLLGVISKDVVTVDETVSAYDIACLMRDNDIGIVVVVTDGKVVGVVSERDIARRVVAANRPNNANVNEFMTTDVMSVDFKEGLNKIYQTLLNIKFRHLLIKDGEKLVGITSRRDLLDVLALKK